MDIKKCYTDSGFPNFNYIMSFDIPFIIVIGGRGIGKTFSCLKWIIENNKYFMYMRRTDVQIETIASDEFNIFTSLNNKLGYNIHCFRSGKNYSCFHTKYEDNKLLPDGNSIGVLVSLATLSNKRGFSGDKIDILFFDEVIPEKHERVIRGEDETFQNAYETINRNRELENKPPLRCIMTTNSNGINSKIFASFGIIPVIENMKRKNKHIHINASKTLCIIDMENSPISDRKKDTVLYKIVAHDSEFYKMAVDNDFKELEYKARPKNIMEYVPLFSVGKITLYRHKSKNSYYCSYHRSGNCEYYSASDIDIKKAKRRYNYIIESYYKNIIDFESVSCKVDFEIYFSI